MFPEVVEEIGAERGMPCINVARLEFLWPLVVTLLEEQRRSLEAQIIWLEPMGRSIID